jgi:hypothetical protein
VRTELVTVVSEVNLFVSTKWIERLRVVTSVA